MSFLTSWIYGSSALDCIFYSHLSAPKNSFDCLVVTWQDSSHQMLRTLSSKILWANSKCLSWCLSNLAQCDASLSGVNAVNLRHIRSLHEHIQNESFDTFNMHTVQWVGVSRTINNIFKGMFNVRCVNYYWTTSQLGDVRLSSCTVIWNLGF